MSVEAIKPAGIDGAGIHDLDKAARYLQERVLPQATLPVSV